MQLSVEGTEESLRKAVGKYEEAQKLFRAQAEYVGEGLTLIDLGRVYYSLAENQKAVDSLTSAAFLLEAKDANDAATALFDIGLVYDTLGEKVKAKEFLMRALVHLYRVGDRASEAATLLNMGTIYSSLGEKTKAKALLEEAVFLNRVLKNTPW